MQQRPSSTGREFGATAAVGPTFAVAALPVTLLAVLLGSASLAQAGNPNCPPPVLPGGIVPNNWSCKTGTQGVGQNSAPVGTPGAMQGNPNCPPPVVNGITPKNWSCKTGTQAVPSAGPAPPQRPSQTAGSCFPAKKTTRTLATVQDLATRVFDNYQDRPIFIAPISNLQGSYLVALSGTQLLTKLGQTTGLPEDISTSLGLPEPYSESVIRSLNAYDGGRGVPSGSALYLVGHSLGGMVAQRLAANTGFSGRWRVAQVITLGSPRTNGTTGGVTVRRFAANGDPVPALAPAAWRATGFDAKAQTWVDNAVPASERWNPFAPHLHYPQSRDLSDYDALGLPINLPNRGTVLVLAATPQQVCDAKY